MTDDTLDDVDVTILDELRALLEIIDPMPEHLADNVKFALTVAALNAEIAELTAHEAVALRSADLALAQSITFTSSTLSLMISVSADHEGTIRLDGWVTQGGANVEVHLDPHPLSLAAKPDRVALADAHGRFVIDALAHGRVVFVVRQHPERADDRPVITPSIEL
jgi:hypothetical protein